MIESGATYWHYWRYWHSDEGHLACETVTMAETGAFRLCWNAENVECSRNYHSIATW